MDKIYGQIDAVEGGEQQESKAIAEEGNTASRRSIQIDIDGEKGIEAAHLETTVT
jgi:hypothetical protein